MIKFSVIIPTYKKPELLFNTLCFLNKQRKFLDETEVIVVDHGSLDEQTRQIVSGFKAGFDLVYVYVERTAGSSHNASIPRNAGIARARGEILIFLDDDILVKEDFLSEHARYHMAGDNFVVIGLRKFLSRDTTTQISGTPGQFPEQITFDVLRDPRYHLFRLFSYNMTNIKDPWHHVYSCNMSVKRKGIQEAGIFFDENFQSWGLEDNEFGYSLFKEGYRILINHKLEVYHQYHPQSSVWEKMKSQHINNIYFEQKHGIKVPVGTGDTPVDDGKGPYIQWMLSYPFKLFQSGGTAFIIQDGSRVDEAKKRIEDEMYVKDKPLIFIMDIAGTDLDLWAQLLEPKEGSFLMYYPATDVEVKSNKFIQSARVEKFIF